MNHSLYATLCAIHKDVFDKFTYRTDMSMYGKSEHWIIPDDFMLGNKFQGDCEDFAMCCRYVCRTLGIASQLAICIDELGEHHCVLHVNGYILDNRHKQVKTVDQLSAIGYNWIAISGFEPNDPWFRVRVNSL